MDTKEDTVKKERDELVAKQAVDLAKFDADHVNHPEEKALRVAFVAKQKAALDKCDDDNRRDWHDHDRPVNRPDYHPDWHDDHDRHEHDDHRDWHGGDGERGDFDRRWPEYDRHDWRGAAKRREKVYANSEVWTIASLQKMSEEDRVRLRLPTSEKLAAIMKRMSYRDRKAFGVPVDESDPNEQVLIDAHEAEEKAAAEANTAREKEPKLGRANVTAATPRATANTANTVWDANTVWNANKS